MPLDPDLTEFSTASPAVASYSYEDIESGEGVVVFQGFASTDSVATTYHLSSNPIKSSPNQTAHVVNNTTTTFTYTFDASTFNLPRTLKGIADVSFQFGNISDGANNAASYIIITIQHWDGTTPTSIGTKTSATITNGAAAYSVRDDIFGISLTEKHFRAGDTLRIKVEHHCVSTGVSNKTFYFSHDPLNAASSGSATGQSQFKINIPFKIDL